MKIAIITGGSRERADDAASATRAIEQLGRKAVALQLDAGKVATFDAFAAEVKAALRKGWDRDRFDTQKLLPLMADGGRIVNVSSGLTRFALPGYSAYAAMKGAVEVLTRYLAKELGARQIAVNTVAPGAIETDFGGGRVRDDAQLNKFVASMTALGRVGLPDDIGPAIASLLSDDNRWVNAQRIEISGGQAI